MADENFDPYYTWLGIRPEEQPPDHYRLIGLRQFEDNADVIANASDRQMQFLRSMQVGKRSAQSQKLLNEISAAGGCLLDPQRKAKYDQELRTKEAAKAQAAKAAAAKNKPLPKATSLTPIPKPAQVSGLAPLPKNDIFSVQMPSAPATPTYTAPSSHNAPSNSKRPASGLDLKSPVVLAAIGGGTLVLLIGVAIAGWMFSGGENKNIAATTPSGTATAAPAIVPATTSNTPPATVPTPIVTTPKEAVPDKTETEKQPPESPKSVPMAESPVSPMGTPVNVIEPPKSDWQPPRPGSKMAFRSLLGNYMYSSDWAKTYPIVNLQVPSKNLWTPEIAEKVRGQVPYDEISYAGKAKIVIPADGIYVLETEKAARVAIDGQVVAEWDTPKGEIKIAGGIHDFTIEVGSHGGNWMRECQLALKQKETGKEVVFFNTWSDIQTFLATPVGGQSVTEVSGWQPTQENEIKDYAQILASAGIRPSLPVVAAGPKLPTPIHYWSFDEKSGDTVADRGKGDSRGKSPLRLSRWGEGQACFVPGRIGNALRFSQQEHFAATDRYVDYPQFTIAFWLKVLGEEGINPRIAHPWVELNYEHRAGVGALGLVVEPNRPEVGRWYHYAVAINQNTREVSIFRDGAEVVDGRLGDYESRRTVKYWAFGHNQDQSNPNDSLHAELDELKIYDRFLTDTEIKQLAAVELAKAIGTEPPGVAGPPSAPVLKATVPDAAAQAAAQAKVASIFVDELKRAKTPAQKTELARSLLDVSTTTPDAAERYVLLAEARRLTTEAKDFDSALLSVNLLGNDFEVDLLAEKTKLLQAFSTGTVTPGQRADMITIACEAGYEALEADNMEIVTALSALVRAQAAKSTAAESKAKAKEFTDQVAQRQKRMAALKKAEQTLATSPDNAAANLLVGLHTFFVRSMEKEGLAMLAKGSDAKLAAAAKARAANTAKGEAASIEEADAWHDAIATVPADFKLEVQRLALDHYTQLAASGSGLVKAKAEKRRQELAAALPAGSELPAKRLRMSDLPKSTPGMVARVLVDGKDAGILVTTQPQHDLHEEKLASILAQAKVNQARLVFIGTFHCDTAGEFRAWHLGREGGLPQVISMDGKPFSFAGGTYDRGGDHRINIPAGDHLIQWVIDFDLNSKPALQTYFGTPQKAEKLDVFTTQRQLFEAKKIPTKMEIDVTK